MFFAAALGLGYPVLNRWDAASTASTSDAAVYYALVTGNTDAAHGHWRYRVLVPYLARPIHALTTGRTGSWSAAAFSMLVVNAAFCAASATLLARIAAGLGWGVAAQLLASFCYLLNFNVANGQLAGLVDSSEFFVMTLLLWTLLGRRWRALPWIGLLAGLAKETATPFATLFALAWTWREESKQRGWVAGMALVGLATTVVVHWAMDGRLVSLLDLAGSERGVTGPVEALVAAAQPLGSWVVWITFAWTLPLAIRGRRHLPSNALTAAAVTLAGVFALVGWSDAGAHDPARPLFNVVGPCLCLAFAAGATDSARSSSRA
jgi:hypothetical protein